MGRHVNVFNQTIVKQFEAWKQEHGMQNAFQDPQEYVKRLQIFADNVASIEEHNAQGHGWTKKVNKFAHLTPAEFKSMYTGFQGVPPSARKHLRDVGPKRSSFVFKGRKSELQESIDWVTAGAVTPVKNQGSCGSCWSFSTTGNMEGAYFNKYKKLVSFSEQALVSCDTVDQGCNGGLPDHAFAYIKAQGGLCAESDYPYVAGNGTAPSCSAGPSCTKITGSAVSGYVDVSPSPQVTPASQEAMMAAVAIQPISVGVEADQSAFQFYSSGVMTGTCGTSLDHAVLVVGYGTDGSSDYWKVKTLGGRRGARRATSELSAGKTKQGTNAVFYLLPVTLHWHEYTIQIQHRTKCTYSKCDLM